CSWLNFLFTLDRLVFILYPKRFKKLQKKKFALKIVLSIPSFFFTNDQVFNKNTNQSMLVCVASPILSISRKAIAQCWFKKWPNREKRSAQCENLDHK
ncbi:hypothetical protein BpHYR1_043543, partial [Brachionus plicatilis]